MERMADDAVAASGHGRGVVTPLSPNAATVAASPDLCPQPGRTRKLLLTLVAGWIPVLVGADAVYRTSRLFPLATSEHPYWIPDHFLLLYIVGPLVMVSAFILVLSPGLFLTLAVGQVRSAGEWVLRALAVSMVVVSVTAGVVQHVLGSPLRGIAFQLVVVACSLVAASSVFWREWRGHALSHRFGALSLAPIIAPVLLLSALMVPKLYWEDFNGDGAHTLEAARLLLHSPVPFWPSDAGGISHWPDLSAVAFVYPVSWFVRLFGPIEAAVRLPFLLFLAALFGGLTAVVQVGRRDAPPIGDQLLLWLALAIYTLVMAYSATYEPYFADVAQPGGQDTLQIAVFTGLVLAFLRGQARWAGLFVLLTLYVSPAGLLLLVLWVGASSLLSGRPAKRMAVWTAAWIITGILASLVAPRLLAWAGQPVPGGEHGTRELLAKFRYLQFTSWRRLGFVLLPCGMLPILSLFLWRRQDPVARAVSVVSLAYFALFYVQAFVSLHYFAPVMVLPLVVLWRSEYLREGSPRRPLARLAVACAGIAALALSWPSDLRIHTESRGVGATIENRVPGYARSSPLVFRSSQLLTRVFPTASSPKVPDESFGGAPLVWNYYAHDPRRASVQPNYVLDVPGRPVSKDLQLRAETPYAALYVRSDSLWQEQRRLQPVRSADNPFYRVPQSTLFRGFIDRRSAEVVDLARFLPGTVRNHLLQESGS